MKIRHPFLQKVSGFIAQHGLLSPQGRVLVALSGGADSMALLKALHDMGYLVEAVHCNFHLRGEESDRDEAFCSHQCAEMGVPVHVVHFATKDYAEVHHVSLEMAARSLRYDYFERLRVDVGAEAVAVAHHKEDSVETVLMNLVRGTGLHGLTGIAPLREHIVRPLLCVDRQEIEAFLSDCGMTYVTDSSNLLDDVVRNKIRLKVLPLLRELNPSVTDAISMTANRLRQAEAIFSETVDDIIAHARIETSDGKTAFDLTKINDEYVLFQILSPYGFKPAMIEDIFLQMRTARSGAVFSSSSHELLIDRDRLLIQGIQAAFSSMKIPEVGNYLLPNQHRLRVLPVGVGEVSFKKDCHNMAYVDAEKVSFPLLVRTALAGDRIHPLGMSGSRLVSDILTDAKVNLFDKRRQLVVADAKGKIIWLVNYRLNGRFRITPTTSKVLKIIYEAIN